MATLHQSTKINTEIAKESQEIWNKWLDQLDQPKETTDEIDEESVKYFEGTKELSKDNLTKKVESTEMVNHPSHYTFGKYEIIDIIKDQLTDDQFIGYCLGNAIKYVSRCQHKGKMQEDIKKAIWYLNQLI